MVQKQIGPHIDVQRTLETLKPGFARSVLHMFGRAYKKLPASVSTCSDQQRRFLDEAVRVLTRNETVCQAHLSMLACMLKQDCWKPSALRDFWHDGDIAMAFLKRAMKRDESKSVGHILMGFVPDSRSEVSGYPLTYTELQKKTFGINDQQHFDAELLQHGHE